MYKGFVWITYFCWPHIKAHAVYHRNTTEAWMVNELVATICYHQDTKWLLSFGVGSGVKLDVPSFSSVGETQHNSVLAILTYENYQKKKKEEKNVVRKIHLCCLKMNVFGEVTSEFPCSLPAVWAVMSAVVTVSPSSCLNGVWPTFQDETILLQSKGFSSESSEFSLSAQSSDLNLERGGKSWRENGLLRCNLSCFV